MTNSNLSSKRYRETMNLFCTLRLRLRSTFFASRRNLVRSFCISRSLLARKRRAKSSALLRIQPYLFLLLVATLCLGNASSIPHQQKRNFCLPKVPFLLSKSQAWYVITRQRVWYRRRRMESPKVHFLRLDAIHGVAVILSSPLG